MHTHVEHSQSSILSFVVAHACTYVRVQYVRVRFSARLASLACTYVRVTDATEPEQLSRTRVVAACVRVQRKTSTRATEQQEIASSKSTSSPQDSRAAVRPLLPPALPPPLPR
jgi:hypothetical protein